MDVLDNQRLGMLNYRSKLAFNSLVEDQIGIAASFIHHSLLI